MIENENKHTLEGFRELRFPADVLCCICWAVIAAAWALDVISIEGLQMKFSNQINQTKKEKIVFLKAQWPPFVSKKRGKPRYRLWVSIAAYAKETKKKNVFVWEV